MELEREKVGLLKDVCGLLRDAAERDKAFQEEVILLKRAKLDIAARHLAFEEKLGQPAQLSIILPEHVTILSIDFKVFHVDVGKVKLPVNTFS